jgi:hypothetical protein
MRRLTVHFEIAFGQDEPEPEQPRDSQMDAYVESTGNVPDPRATLDGRRGIGFTRWEGDE